MLGVFHGELQRGAEIARSVRVLSMSPRSGRQLSRQGREPLHMNQKIPEPEERSDEVDRYV